MRLTVIATLIGLVVVGGVSTASAQCDECGHYIKSGYHRNVLWPWPYVCPDRIAEREPFEIMIRNGWRRQNLLGSYLFNPSTNQLTTAGELQVRWTMTQTPPNFRQIFVEQSIDPAVTAARMASVREYASKVALDGQVPQVYDTPMVAEGRPAAVVDATNVKFMENMPVPVLPAVQNSNGTSTGQ
jgi:hypothetical protein